jgi:hypothetical protein
MAGQLAWSSCDFWGSTFAELHWMHRGFLISQGVDPDKHENPLLSNELKKMMEKFPDERRSTETINQN